MNHYVIFGSLVGTPPDQAHQQADLAARACFADSFGANFGTSALFVVLIMAGFIVYRTQMWNLAHNQNCSSVDVYTKKMNKLTVYISVYMSLVAFSFFAVCWIWGTPPCP